jgi:hypothetical protein
MSYDSRESTMEHINKVRDFLALCAFELNRRGQVHDASKLESPEKEYFDKETPLLAGLVYGTPEYHESCKRLKPALDHHFANNSHHPQHYERGVTDMDLFDVMEMLYDWKASTERGKDGDIMKSIGINAEKFGISKQLKQILTNTINRYNF